MPSIAHKYVCSFLPEHYAFVAALYRIGQILSGENQKLDYVLLALQRKSRGEVKPVPDTTFPVEIDHLS